MSATNLNLLPSNPDHENEFGETALNFAPIIRLSNGQCAVPQQYLDVVRNLDNLSNVLAKITTPENFQLFAGQEGSCLFLLVGVIGQENYAENVKVPNQDKIVYGRRWLIEGTTPTSEIVQTAMLAVKKTREHEIRELVSLHINQGENRTTPFNCHLDLPLMVAKQPAMYSQATELIEDLLDDIRIAGTELKLLRSIDLGEKRIVEVALKPGSKHCHFPELQDAVLTIVCEQADGHDFLHQLMATLIKHSDRFVEENVSFKGFYRFSHNLDVQKLAEFSYQTRNIKATDKRFNNEFTDMSYRVDAAKAPKYNDGELGRQQRALLAQYDSIGGYMPQQ